MPRRADPIIYEAMERITKHGLLEDGAIFTESSSIWTPDNFAALGRQVTEQPASGSGSYIAKLTSALQGMSDPCIQLMAELHFLYLLLPDTIGGQKKRELLSSILAQMQNPVPIPDELDASLDHGWINPGTFYLTRRKVQIAYLVRFGEAWKKLDTGQRSKILADPWAFKRLAYEVPAKSGAAPVLWTGSAAAVYAAACR